MNIITLAAASIAPVVTRGAQLEIIVVVRRERLPCATRLICVRTSGDVLSPLRFSDCVVAECLREWRKWYQLYQNTSDDRKPDRNLFVRHRHPLPLACETSLRLCMVQPPLICSSAIYAEHVKIKVFAAVFLRNSP